jgi:hypothetical protein
VQARELTPTTANKKGRATMPISKINRDNCWDAWSAGRIAAANVTLDVGNAAIHPILANLAINKGYNAIRLWLTWAGSYTLSEADYIAISQDAKGWDSSQLNKAGAKTYAEIAARITDILNACEALGMGVVPVIDFWAYTGGRMWENKPADTNYPTATTAADIQSKLVDFWGKTAAKFGTHKALIGYDVLNEPTPLQTLSFVALNDDSPANTNNWRALANRVATKIRTVDASTPLVVQGIYTGAARGLALFNASKALPSAPRSWLVTDSRVVYSFHYYGPGAISSQGVYNTGYESIGLTYPAGAEWGWFWLDGVLQGGTTGGAMWSIGSVADLTSVCQGAVDFKKAFNAPVFMGEFSAVDIDLSHFTVTADPPRVTESSGNDLNRQVTSITSDGTTVKVLVSNIDPGLFGWRTDSGYWQEQHGVDGFALNTSAANTFVEISAKKAAGENFLPYIKNTVMLNVKGISGNAQQAQVDSLAISAQRVTILHGEFQYVFPATPAIAQLGAFSIGPLPMAGTEVGKDDQGRPILKDKYLPSIGVLTLSPTPQALAAQPASRLALATDLLTMCQKNGFSWAWHAEDNDNGGFVGWRPSPEISKLLRAAAMGRRVYTA